MDAEKLNAKNFRAFCQKISDKLGQAETEVLYAWFYNTFDVKSHQAETETEPQTTNTTPTNESK